MELTIPVAGGEIWAQDTGGDGTPLVLLHPGWGDSSIWGPMVDLLDRPPRRHRIISYDARGYGRSPAPAAPFSQFADLTAVLDHLDVARAGLGLLTPGSARSRRPRCSRSGTATTRWCWTPLTT